jgi:hypothetical protein
MSKASKAVVETLEAAGFASEDLDDLVHEAASEYARAINNADMDSQVCYLLNQGILEEQIYDTLGVPDGE